MGPRSDCAGESYPRAVTLRARHGWRRHFASSPARSLCRQRALSAAAAPIMPDCAQPPERMHVGRDGSTRALCPHACLISTVKLRLLSLHKVSSVIPAASLVIIFVAGPPKWPVIPAKAGISRVLAAPAARLRAALSAAGFTGCGAAQDCRTRPHQRSARTVMSSSGIQHAICRRACAGYNGSAGEPAGRGVGSAAVLGSEVHQWSRKHRASGRRR